MKRASEKVFEVFGALRSFQIRFIRVHPRLNSLLLLLFLLENLTMRCRRGTLFHFFRRNILDVRANVPHVSEGIRQAPHAIAVELIFKCPLFLGACLNGLLENCINVVDIEHDTDEASKNS